MSKNYKIGRKFRVTSNETNGFQVGEIVKLVSKRDDGLFEMYNEEFCQALFWHQFELVCEPASSKLKPAKQALADAIHQNGGWVRDHFLFATSNADCIVTLWVSMPIRDGNHFDGRTGNIKIDWRFHLCRLIDRLPNWHQTILSRDEYFSAYPEQVKVEVNSETERKGEVEMKSESEMTIKVGDWHKNGELPPVGEVCQFFSDGYDDDWFDWCVFRGTATCGGIIIEYRHRTSPNRTTVTLFDPASTQFRPLRTERDKAIEEMANVVGLNVSVFEVEAGKLYDAGYRKEVK